MNRLYHILFDLIAFGWNVWLWLEFWMGVKELMCFWKARNFNIL